MSVRRAVLRIPQVLSVLLASQVGEGRRPHAFYAVVILRVQQIAARPAHMVDAPPLAHVENLLDGPGLRVPHAPLGGAAVEADYERHQPGRGDRRSALLDQRVE
eukprot:CAMPEP_0174727168 /NCGR_PEP_ID=MMETSP1094-20130205/49231_1 /TAXON_ID=156173 /ORGANISM="Chrysochromulina brevifilum, Strain UTEX LB 985" /LENGTH=103 /DNA_ID=CAMNT_0015928853 /DNA_START=37 /DNA_END=348 /DNA_ORIENTATION=-